MRFEQQDCSVLGSKRRGGLGGPARHRLVHRDRGKAVQSTLRSFDLAHLAHVELLTPKPDESLRFFIDVMGMTESGRRGRIRLSARLG